MRSLIHQKRNSKVTKKQEREDKLTQYLLLEVTIDNPKKATFFDDVIQVSSGEILFLV